MNTLTLPPPRFHSEPMLGTIDVRFASDADPDSELRKALSLRRLSAFDVTRSGIAPADRAARLVRDTNGRLTARHSARGKTPVAARRCMGCEVCRSPSVAEGLCGPCRQRLSMPLVDRQAAQEAAERYRAEHPRPAPGPAPTDRPAPARETPGRGAPTPDIVILDERQPAA